MAPTPAPSPAPTPTPANAPAPAPAALAPAPAPAHDAWDSEEWMPVRQVRLAFGVLNPNGSLPTTHADHPRPTTQAEDTTEDPTPFPLSTPAPLSSDINAAQRAPPPQTESQISALLGDARRSRPSSKAPFGEPQQAKRQSERTLPNVTLTTKVHHFLQSRLPPQPRSRFRGRGAPKAAPPWRRSVFMD